MKSTLSTKNLTSSLLMAALASSVMTSAQAGSGVSPFYKESGGNKVAGLFTGGKSTAKGSGVTPYYNDTKSKSDFAKWIGVNKSVNARKNKESRDNSKVGYSGFSNPVVGYEIGLERQLEVEDNGDKFVNRLMARYQSTFEWEVAKDKRGSTFDVEAKGGLTIGRYKGSEFGSNDPYGSVVTVRTGFTGEALGVYTYNTDKIDPFYGASADFEFVNTKRYEWQADAIVGAKFNVTDTQDLSVRYQKTLAHGLTYTKEGKDYRQDEGYAIALIGEQRNPDGSTHTLKLEHEHFDRSPSIIHDGRRSHEPKIGNTMLSYQKTF